MRTSLVFTSPLLLLTLALGGCSGDDSATASATATDTSSSTTDATDTSTSTVASESDTGTTTDASTTAPSTTDPSTTDPSTTDPSTTDPSTTDPSTTDPSTTDGTTTDDTTTENPNACPAEPGDDPCTACSKENCCDEVKGCEADAKCSCFADCIGEGGAPIACSQMCQIPNPLAEPAIAALLQCSQGSCADQCT
jgi:hypothetical protein